MSINTVKLKDLYIGSDYPIQLVGEIGQNHNGSVETAKEMIDMCKRSGIKIVKFQKRDIDNEFTKEAYNKPYTNRNSFGKTYGLHRKFLELSKEQHSELKNYAETQGMIYFCTPCDIQSLKIMEDIDCPFYKVASRDITNIPLLKELGKIGKTVIISTGMANKNDIDTAIKYLNLPVNKLIIMQCTSSYPCEPKDTNLNVIKTFKEFYPYPIGFSDHTEGIAAAKIAASIGVNIIEKHITLDKASKGTDHKCSCEFDDLRDLTYFIKNVSIYLGSSNKKIEDCVSDTKIKLMKSLTSIKNIKKGEILTEEMICLKCPGDGLFYEDLHKILGKKAKYDIDTDITLSIDNFH